MGTSSGSRRARLVTLVSIAVLGPGLGGCEEQPTTPGGTVVVALTINPPDLTMGVGEVLRLDLLPFNGEGRVVPTIAATWSSSAPAVAAVDSTGFVRALAEGTAELRAVVGRVTATARVSVGPTPASEWKEHSCAVEVSGAVWCWGRGGNGELGNGARASLALPARVRLESTVASVSTGASHSCAIATSGFVWCWGRGAEGQLGNGAATTRSVPVRITDDASYRAISAGGRHSCGITSSSELRCWGFGLHGQLGNGRTVSVATPIAPSGGVRFDRVSAGARHTCALTPDGQAWCWGDNEFGQLGDGSLTVRTTPVPVATALRFGRITAGARHSCAVTADGSAWCWGDNRQAQLGNGSLTSSTTPTEVRSGVGFRLSTIAAGGSHTCGLDRGVVYCWGAGQFGQLGNGARLLVGNPVQVGVALFDDLLVGNAHSCGVSRGGSVLCWGLNAFGQLGVDDFRDRAVPTPVAGGLRFARAEG